jgi:orotidine-5'-phosphate decarboxylase
MEEARRLVELLKDDVGLFKVGLELFTVAGFDAARLVTESGRGLFLDLKLHDIPETVKRAAKAAADLEARFVTVHAASEGMLAAAVEGAGEDRVLAVTLLTSVGTEEAGGRDPGEIVLERAGMAIGAGCTGVVCAASEASLVKENFPTLIVVTPGIRPAWAADPSDQRRVATPAEAIKAGADYIVVGRPIRDYTDPREAARRITEEISSVAQD